jgi:creatinine amidohydrolase
MSLYTLVLRIATAVALCGALVVPTSTSFAAPDSVYLEDLTWPELKQRIQNGATTIILPVGGTEQNGSALALGKHNVRVRLLAEKIAFKLGNALVAPVVAYVPEGGLAPPTAHMRFPGTITMPEATFESMLEYAARSFKLHGFHDIVLLGDHGGYQVSLKAVAERLNREWADSAVRVHALPEYYRASQDEYARTLERRGYQSKEIGIHAGLADSSLMLALDPRLVRPEQFAAAAQAGSRAGVSGDPRRASAELGQMGVDAIVAASVTAIRQAVARAPK